MKYPIFKDKEVEVITIKEAFKKGHPLNDILSITSQDREIRNYDEFFYDCDHVKSRGEKGRGDGMFFVSETDSTAYIVTRRGLSYRERQILEWWMNGSEDEIEIDSNWRTWDDVSEGVAYRGGSGYLYSLYAKRMVGKAFQVAG